MQNSNGAKYIISFQKHLKTYLLSTPCSGLLTYLLSYLATDRCIDFSKPCIVIITLQARY